MQEKLVSVIVIQMSYGPRQAWIGDRGGFHSGTFKAASEAELISKLEKDLKLRQQAFARGDIPDGDEERRFGWCP